MRKWIALLAMATILAFVPTVAQAEEGGVYVLEGGITAACGNAGDVTGTVILCCHGPEQSVEGDVFLTEHIPGSGVWNPTEDFFHIATTIPANGCVQIPFGMMDGSSPEANSIRIETDFGNEKSESFPPCSPPPLVFNWWSSCEGGGADPENPEGIEGEVEYLWWVSSEGGVLEIDGSFPVSETLVLQWNPAPMGETAINVGWSAPWGAGGQQWLFSCPPSPPPTPPRASFSLDCVSYQFGLEPGGCQEAVRATVEVTVTHRLGTFRLNREITTTPGNAASAANLLPQIYGHTEAEGWLDVFCGNSQTGHERWILSPSLECQEYVAKCNECCDSCGFQCDDGLACVIIRPGELGSDRCRLPSNPNSETCSPPEFVPEPGTAILLGTGLAGLTGYAGLRRRKRK